MAQEKRKQTKKESPKTLEQELKRLNERLDRANSPKWEFIRGLAKGIGVAIGATIVAGILISILARTIHTVEDIPLIGDIIQKTQVEQIITNQQ